MSEEVVVTPVAEAATIETPEVVNETGEINQEEVVVDDTPKFKIKNADGTEIEVDIEELKRGYQRDDSKLKAAQRRFQEAAKIKKQTEAFLAMAKTNPGEALKRLGVNVDEFINAHVNNLVEQARMSPEEAQRRQLEAELQRYKQAEQAKLQEEQERLNNAEFEKVAQDYSQKIMTALESVNIPKTPESGRRVAQYMLQAHQRKIDLSPQEAAQLVREDYLNDMKALLTGASDESLLELLGEDVAKKIVKTNLAKHQAKTQGASKPIVNKQPVEKKDEPPKVFDRAAWRESLLQKV